MPHGPQIQAEIRNWKFDKQHKLVGRVYNDQRNLGLLDGDPVHIFGIKSITEYGDHYIVKTHAYCYIMFKDHEDLTLKNQNALALVFYYGGTR